MAQENPQSDVFKFVALRPPMPPSRDATSLGFTADDRPARETPVGRFVSQFNAQNAATIAEKVAAFITSNQYDTSFPQSRGDVTLDAIAAAIRKIPPDEVNSGALTDAVARAADRSPEAYLQSQDTVQMLHGLWDRYYAFYILNGFSGQDLSRLTDNLRLLHLLNLLARGRPIGNAATLAEILAATPLIDKLFTSLPRPPVETAPPVTDTLPAETARAYEELWRDIVETNNAIGDVRNLKLVGSVHKETVKLPPSMDVRAAERNGLQADAVASRKTDVSLRVSIDPASFAALPAPTKSLLSGLRLTQETLRKPDAIDALNTRMAELTARAAAIDDSRFLGLMPPAAAQVRGMSTLAFGQFRIDDKLRVPPFIRDLAQNVRGQIKPLGIGDLKVVKQTLRAYVAGEIAHIENVLRGEYKERKYRVLDRTEETVTVAQETVEDTTRDTQTTERFELKKESDNTIQEQMSVQAGVTVSGSYGTVTFGAHGDFAYGTSSQQSSKTSSNFAREVVDKAVSRIQKTVKTERVTKQLHEVEEIDTHGLDNKGQPDNLSGIYRWVDKHYEAQIFNYGKRLMFEFIVPEPSAFFQYAQSHQPKQVFTPPKDLPLGLTHKDISELNYQTYIRAYQVQGCTPPPPEYKVISLTLSSDAQIDNGTSLAKASKELVVPEGYEAESLSAALSFVYENYPQFKLSVGADHLWYSSSNDHSRRRNDWVGGTTGMFDNIIPVAIACYDVNAYFVSVMATCHRQSTKYETWQIQTFEKIMSAYQALKASYDQQVAQQAAQQGVVIHGQNPAINREIEKTELKKHCVKLLMDKGQFGSFSAMKQIGSDAPDFDLFQAVREGKVEQFYEQAFEWENITYLFYPYFWGRADQWIQKVTSYDEDPLFTKFLQSGAARVVVPVHPGYNDAVMYFLENDGAIWNGGDTPRLNDPLFISLADELRNQTDDLQGATPDGDPWTVVLPTTLVYLQADATLPTFP